MPITAPLNGTFTCLSVRQPWAWLLVHGWKNVENRGWPTAFRGTLLIHAGRLLPRAEYEACRIFVAGFSDIQLPPLAALPCGGIVGAGRVLDCVRHHPSEWFCGPFGLVVAEQQPLPFVPMRGFLGLWNARFSNGLPLAAEDSAA